MAQLELPADLHPLPAGTPFCRVIPGFLTANECRTLIAESEERGFRSAGSDYPPSYRSNDRQVFDDEALADRLFARLRGRVPETLVPADSCEAPWRIDSINARLRLCRYRPGQAFGLHQDGVHHRGVSCRSQLTFMVYLTDGQHFDGGDTVFYDGGPGAEVREIGRVRPRAGTLIVFDHGLWHAGATVDAGIKHVLRSDVLYRREGEGDGARASPNAFDTAHRGYVWALESLGGERFASGGRDTEIHVWERSGRLLATLAGHRRSVLGLAAFGEGRLASVSRDRSLRLWRVDEARCDRVVEHAHEAAVLCVLALPDGRLATAGADGGVRLWTADGETCGCLAPAPAWVWSLVPLPGARLAGACEDGAIRIWDLASGRCIASLAGESALRTLAVGVDGRRMVSGDIAGRVAVWASAGLAWTSSRVDRPHAAAVRRVRLVGDGLLASVGEDGAVRMSSLAGGAWRDAGLHVNFATDVVRVGDTLLSCGYDGCIRPLALGTIRETRP